MGSERKPFIIGRHGFADPERQPVRDRETGDLIGYVQRDAETWRALDPGGDFPGHFYFRINAAERVWDRQAEVPHE